MEPVRIKTYDALPVDRAALLRYARAGAEAPPLLEECLAEAARTGPGRVCWRRFPVYRRADALDFGFAAVRSQSLARHLDGCKEIILFAATAGLGLDRLISRYASVSPSRAFLFDAIGTERVESLCDAFCADMEADLGPLRPRFSPGYGDLPLSLQKEIVAALDCQRKIGLTLNESLLMTPSKSVTAIAGLGCGDAAKTGCESCDQENCAYRKSPWTSETT